LEADQPVRRHQGVSCGNELGRAKLGGLGRPREGQRSALNLLLASVIRGRYASWQVMKARPLG
jgi:hypothetical protein